MFQVAHSPPYIPEPETIARMAAEIHNRNLQIDPDEEITLAVDRRGGPKLLLLTIVEQAVSTLDEWNRKFGRFTGTPRAYAELRNNARRAYRYLKSDRNLIVTDFLAVCEVTDACPEAIRERVFRNFTPESLSALLSDPRSGANVSAGTGTADADPRPG